MRKYIIIGLFLAVNIAFAAYNPPPSTFPKIAQVPEAVANMNFGVIAAKNAGGVSCASCNSGTDETIASSSETPTSDNGDAYWWGWEFTISGSQCITGIKYSVRDGGGGKGATCEVYDDTGAAGAPGTTLGANYTGTVADLHNYGYEWEEMLFPSTQTLTTGTYFAVCKPVTTSVIYSRPDSISGDIYRSTDSGANWQTDEGYLLMIGYLGCAQ